MTRRVQIALLLLILGSGAACGQDHEDRLVLLPKHDWTMQLFGGRYGYAGVQWTYLGAHDQDHVRHYLHFGGSSLRLTTYHAASAAAGVILLLACGWTLRGRHNFSVDRMAADGALLQPRALGVRRHRSPPRSPTAR